MKRALAFIMFLFLFSSPALAQDLDFFLPTIELTPEGLAETSMSVTLTEPNLTEFRISLFNIKLPTLNTTANFPGFSCEADEKLYGADLVCDISQATQQFRSFNIEYTSKDPTSKDGAKSLFEQEFLVPYNTEIFSPKILLPQGMVLSADDQSYLPESGSVTSDGRKIVVYWKQDNVKADTIFGIKVSYEPSLPDIPYELLVAAIIIAGILYFLSKRKRTIKSSVIMPILKSDEKLVLKGILKYGDGVSQKILVRESGYSKAKVSKVLKNLTERKIVRLERTGRSNRVFLVRKIEEK